MASITNVGPKFLVICMFLVYVWSSGISPEVSGLQESLLLITRFTSGGMQQTQHLVPTQATREGQDICHVMTSAFRAA